MSPQLWSLLWIATGLAGGVLLHRRDPIKPLGWPMAGILGPFTLLLGILERWPRS